MTTNLLKILCLSSALSVSASAVAADNPREEIGTNAAVKGLVTITGYDAKPLQAIVRKPVYMGDEVNARHESSLQVLLKDKTVFTVGPETQLTIDEYIYNDKKAANRLSASVKRGMFRFVSGKASQESPENITINTPTASMGIRGTIFEGLVGPEALLCAEKEGVLIPGIEIDYTGASLIVLRGPGQNSNTNNRKGQIEVTSGGETVTLTESGTATFISNKDFRPSPPFAISQPLFDYFNRRLRTEPRGDMNFEPFEADPRIIRPVITLEPNDDEGLTPYNPVDDLDVPGSSIGDDLGGGLDVIGGGTDVIVGGPG